jgi:hypothetical protein
VCCVFVLKIAILAGVRWNLSVVLIWQREFQGTAVVKLSCGYHWLLSAIFVVRIGSKKIRVEVGGGWRGGSSGKAPEDLSSNSSITTSHQKNQRAKI